MASKRTLAQRLINISKTWNPNQSHCRISSSASSVPARIHPNPAEKAPDPRDDGFSHRFLQGWPIYRSAATVSELRSLPRGEKLLEKLRGMDAGRDRIRLDGLFQPQEISSDWRADGKLTVEDARKLLRVSQLETVKSKLRQIPRNNVSLEEFVQICSESCGSTEQGLEFAKMLDESGTIIVLGNVVFLRPEQESETIHAPDLKRVKGSTFQMVVKVIQGLIPTQAAKPNDPRWKELEEMEKQKAVIDKRSESLVRRELWCGLGYLVIQTAAFMRLTFWELSWDVMEPICFYVTSIYFMAGYTFFLRTSKEPSFEGFFQSRFNAKQKRLMRIHDFNVARYNELRRACYPGSSNAAASSSTPSFDNSEKKHAGVVY